VKAGCVRMPRRSRGGVRSPATLIDRLDTESATA
jgi:hypothetical protein